tara:strand:+ start:88 stop:282 length:195 start_codon:yes stop_codon:yes gene_type:complete
MDDESMQNLYMRRMSTLKKIAFGGRDEREIHGNNGWEEQRHERISETVPRQWTNYPHLLASCPE